MINQQLLDYIRQQVAVGVSREDITKALASSGWNPLDVQEAFAALRQQGFLVPSAPIAAQPTNQKTASPGSVAYDIPTQVVASPISNTSGQGKSAIVPKEIQGWNWGAFGFSWIWGIGNKVYIALLIIVFPVVLAILFILVLLGLVNITAATPHPGVPLLIILPFIGYAFYAFTLFVSIGMSFVLGIKGNEWAWAHRHWDSIEHFKKVQRIWARVWLALILFSFLAGLFVVFSFFYLFHSDIPTHSVGGIQTSVSSFTPTQTSSSTGASPISSVTSPPPTCSLLAVPSVVLPGVPYSLFWTSHNATNQQIVGSNGITITPPPGNTSGSEQFSPTGTWIMTVSNSAGADTCQTTVTRSS